MSLRGRGKEDAVQPHPPKYFGKVVRFVGIFLPVKRQYSTIPTNYHLKIYPLGDAKEKSTPYEKS
jgi:hypothetical protein